MKQGNIFYKMYEDRTGNASKGSFNFVNFYHNILYFKISPTVIKVIPQT